MGTLTLMEHANLNSIDANYFKLILETLIRTVCFDKKKIEKNKFEILHIEDNEEDLEGEILRANEEIINIGIQASKDVNQKINLSFKLIATLKKQRKMHNK